MHRIRHERGAAAVEYGLIVFAIAAVIVAVVFLLGTANRDSVLDSCNKIATETGGTC